MLKVERNELENSLRTEVSMAANMAITLLQFYCFDLYDVDD